MNNLQLERLRALLPSGRVTDSSSALAAFQSDGLTAFAVKPSAVVVPQTKEEVLQTVCWCHEQNVPFVARGSGTSLSGGSLPHADGVVITLNRLNQIKLSTSKIGSPLLSQVSSIRS